MKYSNNHCVKRFFPYIFFLPYMDIFDRVVRDYNQISWRSWPKYFVHKYLKINSSLGKYIGRSKMTNFLNSGKTWINIKDMYILTYLSADQFWIDNLIWDGVSIFKIQNKLQVTQDLLAFCTKCKKTFRVIDETLEFAWL